MNYYYRLLAACVITLFVLIPADSQLLAVANCQPLITTRLAQGSRGQEVVNLQNFLINQGFLTQGNASGYFGRMTLAALKMFQSQYNIVSSGTANTTGYGAVGPKTRDVINTMNCGGASQVSSGMTTSSSLSTTNANNSTSKYARLTVNGSHQPSAVVAGSAVNLTWDVSPSTMSCSAFATPSDSTPWGTGTAGVVPVSGSQVMHPQVKTNYIISCVDSLTSSGVYDTVTVDVTAGNLSAAMMSSSNVSSNTVASGVTVELKADGKDVTSLVQYGWASTLTWNVFPAATAVTSCTGSGSGLGVKDVDATNWNKTQGRYGVLSVWPAAATTYKITCLLSDGQQVSDTVTVDVATANGQYGGALFTSYQAPTVMLSALTTGTNAWKLEVTFTGADSCTRNKNGVFYSNYFTGGSNSSQTSQFTSNIENLPYTVSITCTGPGGTTTSAPVTIAVLPPTIDLNVNGNQGPISATAGSAVYLDWNGTATTNVAIPCTTASTPASAWSIARPLVGIDVPVYPTAATTVYSITCTDSQGRTATDSITVNVGNQSTNEVQISLGAWTNNGSTFVPLTDGQSIPNYDANTNVSVSSLQVSWIANGSYNSGSTVCTLTSSPNVFAGRTLPTVTSAAVTFNPPVGQAVTYTVTCQRSDGVSQSDSKTVTLAQQQSQQPSSFFKVGDRVYVKGANVNARPNPTITSTPAALHLIDDLGTITAGPIVADGYTWWNVDYIIGTDGWTVENYLGLGAVSLNPVSKIFYFNASPATITNGQTTTLSWYANATNCGVFQNASDNTAIGGGYLPGVASVQNPGVTSMTVSPSATWTYTLKCYKDFGSYSQGSPTVSQPITVTVNEGAAPVIYSFTATPVGSAPIRTINLSWSTDATSCRVEQQTDSLGGNMQVTGVSQVIQNGGASGSLQVSPKSSGVFILVCQKNRKSAVKSLPVTAEYTNNDPTTLALRSELSNPSNNPVTVDIKMNNSSGVNGVVPLNGAPLTVDWSSNNATTCYTSEPNMSGLTSPGSMNSIQTPSIYPRLELPFTYTVTCRGRVGPYVEGQFYYVSASDTLTARVGQ